MIKLYYTQKNSYWQEGEAGFSYKAASDIAVTVEEYQTIEGFGGCFNELGMIALNQLDEKQKSDLMDKLFGSGSDLKFQYCRLPVGANDYSESWYSHNETDGDYEMACFSIERDKKYLIPFIKEGLKRNPNIKLFASPWSPPAWMKNPKVYNYGKLVWNDTNLKAYALYLAKFVGEYEKEGIKISQIHVQNEVIADQKFPSCVWTSDELREFIRNYLGPLFEEAKIPAEIWLGTLNCPEFYKGYNTDFDDYVFKILLDDKAKRYIKGLSIQYAGKALAQRCYESFPGVPVIQSENECGDGTNSWEYAKYIFKLFRHYLTNGVTGYIYWNMILKPPGMSTWGSNQNSLICIDGNNIIFNPEYYVMKHFSNFIGKGSVRLGIKGGWSGNAAAFRNDRNEIVICILNPLKESRDIIISYDEAIYKVTLNADSINTIVIA